VLWPRDGRAGRPVFEVPAAARMPRIGYFLSRSRSQIQHLRGMRATTYSRAMLRTLVTELTPPFALRAAQRMWRRSRDLSSHTFEGYYPSIDTTPCGRDRYGEKEIAQSTVGSAINGLKNAGSPKPIIDDGGQSLLPTLVSLFGGPLTVLDFGAGPARGLINILDHAPEH